jgi:hypothetical protein
MKQRPNSAVTEPVHQDPQADISSPNPNPVAPQNPRRNKQKFLLILVVILVLAVAGEYFLIKRTNDKKSSATQTDQKVTVQPTQGKNAQQTPQKYERIIGLASAPPDFQDFIKTEFDKRKTACLHPEEMTFTIKEVVRDTFAEVGYECRGGYTSYYAKQSDGWKHALDAQNIPDCKGVNEYKISKELIPECVNYPENGPAADTDKHLNTNP